MGKRGQKRGQAWRGLNINRLKKEEILWLWNHYCKHRHRYLIHQSCFISENPRKDLTERVGHLDIESTGLNANFDFVISWALLSDDGKMYGRVLTSEETLDYDILDKNLTKEFCDAVKNFDRIVVYWGKDRRHDLPFLRTRSLKWNHQFPMYKDVSVTDAYDIAKNKLRLHRNRLENVCDFLKIPAKIHRLDAEIWQKAKLGHKHSLNHVWEHNKEDVISLKAVYDKLIGFTAHRKVSI